jgi:hypothetical protein
MGKQKPKHRHTAQLAAEHGAESVDTGFSSAGPRAGLVRGKMQAVLGARGAVMHVASKHQSSKKKPKRKK